METVVLNHNHSGINIKHESVYLRAVYLLMEEALLAGDSYSIITISRTFDSKIVKPEEMLEIVHRLQEIANEEESPEWEETARQMTQTLKIIRKIKHLNTEGIILKKKMEKSIKDVYEVYVKEFLEKNLETGLPQLLPLLDAEEFNVYAIDPADSENETGNHYSMSKLLMRDKSEFEETPMFCLGFEFFNPDFINLLNIVSADDSQADKEDAVYYERAFIIPNINMLSSDELLAIRRQLSPSLQLYHEKVKEWMKMAVGGFTASERRAFFREQVMPSTVVVLQSMADNELLKHCSRVQDNKVVADIYLGEAPVDVLWNFYRQNKIIPDKTWEILQQAKEINPALNGRMPFMVLRVSGKAELDAIQQVKTEESEKPVSLKKSLSID